MLNLTWNCCFPVLEPSVHWIISHHDNQIAEIVNLVREKVLHTVLGVPSNDLLLHLGL